MRHTIVDNMHTVDTSDNLITYISDHREVMMSLARKLNFSVIQHYFIQQILVRNHSTLPGYRSPLLLRMSRIWSVHTLLQIARRCAAPHSVPQ